MPRDDYKTVVLFLMDESNWEDCIAVFPLGYTPWDDTCYYAKLFPIYTHIGQHSEGSVDYIIEQRPAKKEEYKALQRELESIGYDLFVLNDPINHLWINFINDD